MADGGCIWTSGLAYLATPYTKYVGGLTEAWKDACTIAGRLIKQGMRVYSPIAHTHPIAAFGKIDPRDHEIWLPFDQVMMERSDALVIAHLPGWDSSRGIAHEVGVFIDAGKPIFDLDPDDLTMTRRK